MTVIVGLEWDNRVYLGADSASVAGYESFATRLRKVFRRGPFLIGYTTSFRMGQLLQYRLTAPEHPEGMDALEYMATHFTDAVRACLKDGGYARIESGVEQGGQFLVGYQGKLYQVDSDFQVNSNQEEFAAIGQGAPYALGVLYERIFDLEFLQLEPEKLLLSALRSAEHFCAGVRAPHYVEVL